LVQTKPAVDYEVKGVAGPAMARARHRGATDMVNKLVDALYLVDINIEQWNIQLMRAQPLRTGRLQIQFLKNSCVTVDGHKIYEIEPVIGKLILMKSGTWSFFRLNARDKYKKLSDLRVGRSLPSDALVIRLVDRIEMLLERRAWLVDTLATLRSGVPGKLASVLAACAHASNDVVDMAARVRLDWNENPHAAELAVKNKNRDRYLARKAKAVAMSGQVRQVA
jgi:hypothetical protein